jgi:hypothetical protein
VQQAGQFCTLSPLEHGQMYFGDLCMALGFLDYHSFYRRSLVQEASHTLLQALSFGRLLSQ